MRIEHLALYTANLEEMKSFYETYFHVKAGEKYVNETKGFSSYFLLFDDGARLEIMNEKQIEPSVKREKCMGYAHMAIAVGSMEAVNEMTVRMIEDGVEVICNPRHTGDGYYESLILDPEGNRVEITV